MAHALWGLRSAFERAGVQDVQFELSQDASGHPTARATQFDENKVPKFLHVITDVSSSNVGVDHTFHLVSVPIGTDVTGENPQVFSGDTSLIVGLTTNICRARQTPGAAPQ